LKRFAWPWAVVAVSRRRQVLGYFRVDLLDTLRFWPISLFSVALTAFYYAMLAEFIPPAYRDRLTVAFLILAVLGVAMFHFSARTSWDRIDPWHSFVRTLPAPLWVRFVARFLLVLSVASFSAIVLLAVGVIRFGLTLDATPMVTILVAVPVAAAVFAPVGACVGGTLHPRAAPTVLTIIYLFTAWSGGLWSGGRPPEAVRPIESVLPLFAIQRFATAIATADWATALPAVVVVGLWIAGGLLLSRGISLREEAQKFT
jgi:ABC-2 type transport system permease protein